MVTMAETATEIITIDAPHERVWQIALDLESYPMWAHDIKDVNIRATDEEGRPLEVEFRASALGRSTHYTLKYDFTNAPHEMGWSMLSGDIQRSIDGVWRFEADGGYFYGSDQLIYTALLLCAVWALPNTQEIMYRYRPALERVDFRPRSRLAKLFTWRPVFGYAGVTALLFVVCLLSLRRVSEFLYFQF